ncbi:MAG: ABC transporter permease [Pirellulaceae bacterium]
MDTTILTVRHSFSECLINQLRRQENDHEQEERWMSNLAVQRIAWKEFRQQIVFFALLAAIAFGVQMLVVLSSNSRWFSDAQGTAHFAFVFVGLFAILYAAACGATLYATEKEERTFQMLQTLPISSRHLLTGKLSVAIALCMAFLVAAILIATLCAAIANVVFYSRLPGQPMSWAGQFLGTFGLGVVEFFAWSWLFSLLLRRPLVAAILGIAVASTVVQIITHAVTVGVFEPFTLAPYAGAAGYRAAALVPVLLLSAWVASQWLQDQKIREQSTLLGGSEPSTTEPTVTSIRPRVSRLGMFGRFLWQACRTSWPLMLLYAGCMGVLVALGLVAAGQFLIYSFSFALLLASVAGAFTFSSDKIDRGERFMANHGERPVLYWSANVMVWLGWIIMVNAIIVLAFLIFAGTASSALTTQGIWALDQVDRDSGFWNDAGGMFVMLTFSLFFSAGMVLCFAGGQLCSLLIRSRVVAGIAALLVSVPLASWHVLMMVSETPLWWSVLPLILALSVAGLLATRRWLSNRSKWTSALPILLVPVVVWAGLAAGVIRKRQTEIPVYPLDIAHYRTDRGEPDAAILNEIRIRFVEAFAMQTPQIDDGETVRRRRIRSRAMFPATRSLLQDYLDYRAAWPNLKPEQQGLGIQPGGKQLLGTYESPSFWQFMSDDNRADWQQWSKARLGIDGFAWQFELAQQFVLRRGVRIEELKEAIQFAADNMEHIERMEPAFEGKKIPRDQPVPPLPVLIADSSDLLLLDFYAALMRDDCGAAWKTLQSYAKYKKIHATIYAHENWRFRSFEHYERWLRCPNLDAEMLREALAFVRSDWTLSVDRTRQAEKQYLDATQQIQSGIWDSGRMGWVRHARIKHQLINLFPWERVRSQQLVDLWSTWYVEVLRSRKQAEETRFYRSAARLWTDKIGEKYGPNSSVSRSPRFGLWVDNTILPPVSGMFNYLIEQGREGKRRWYSRNESLRLTQTKRDMLILKMAVMLWQLEKDEMPTDLAEVVKEYDLVDVFLPPRIIYAHTPEAIYKLYVMLPETGSGDRYIVNAENAHIPLATSRGMPSPVSVGDGGMLHVPRLSSVNATEQPGDD